MLSIDIDFGLAYRQADDIMRCADELLRQYRNLGMSIVDVRDSWQGDASAAYIEKLEAFGSQLQADAARCRELAAAFRAKVDEIKAAEEEATSVLSSLLEVAN